MMDFESVTRWRHHHSPSHSAEGGSLAGVFRQLCASPPESIATMIACEILINFDFI